MINEGTGGHGNKRTSTDHPNNCIINIGLNTEKILDTLGELLSLQ